MPHDRSCPSPAQVRYYGIRQDDPAGVFAAAQRQSLLMMGATTSLYCSYRQSLAPEVISRTPLVRSEP
jgi:hypothetical protein